MCELSEHNGHTILEASNGAFLAPKKSLKKGTSR
jgi:hypothetical protein